MRRFATSSKAIMVLAGLAVAVGLVTSLTSHDFLWLARFSSLVVAAGVALVSRFALLGRDPRPEIGMDGTYHSLDPEYYRNAGLDVSDWLPEELAHRRAAGVLGPLVTLAGTILWGFSDALNLLPGYGH